MSNQYGWFWNSNSGDRTYNADSFEDWLKPFFQNGVFTGGMQTTASGSDMVITVSSGTAYINGKVRTFDTDTSFTLAAASSAYPRIDTVVVERNDTDRQITLKVVQGKYSGSTASPTAPVRTGGVYQLVLAQIAVGAGVTKITASDITDTRINSNLCGYVAATIDNPDFEQWYTQNEAQFDEWFNEMKDQLSTDAAGHLQNEVDALETTVDGLVDKIYPVGSIYMSVNGTSPATLFGGTWQRIQGCFLLGASSTYSAGSTGGEATHTLTFNEMPAHNHGAGDNLRFTTHVMSTSISHDGTIGTGSTWIKDLIGTAIAGGGAAHNNMPPYLSVYMWKRTA